MIGESYFRDGNHQNVSKETERLMKKEGKAFVQHQKRFLPAKADDRLFLFSVAFMFLGTGLCTN
jgi:hypothetical protein